MSGDFSPLAFSSTTSWVRTQPACLDEVISVVHSKGGAGKSSLTTNIAYALAGLGLHVLVIDMDRQAGQSVGMGIPAPVESTIGNPVDVGAVLLGEAAIDKAVVRDVYPNLDLLPADETSLQRAESHLERLGTEGHLRLADVLESERGRWDVVLIDTPGRQSGIVSVALTASSGALIPAVPEGGPVNELGAVLTRIDATREQFGQPEIYGLVRMRVGGNSGYRRLAEEQTLTIAGEHGAYVFRNKIPEDARFGESHLAREPVGNYAPSARSAMAYRFVAVELGLRQGWIRPADVEEGVASAP